MADNVLNIFEGPATVAFQAYVAPIGGAEPVPSTWVDVGAIKGGVKYHPVRSYHDIETDHSIGVYDTVKIKEAIDFSFQMQEISPANVLLAMDMPSSVLTGSYPAQTIARALGSRQLKMMQIVSTNLAPNTGGVNKVTITSWRCVITEIADVPFTKEGETLLNVKVRAFVDPGITAALAAQDTKFVFATA